MIKFLHLLSDSIFADFVINEFEYWAPGENLYWLDVPNSDYLITHIRNHDHVIRWIKGQCPDKGTLSNLKAVFFHSLNSSCIDIMNALQPSTRIFWFTWGFDLYPYCWSKEKLFLPMTYQFWQARMRRQKASLKERAKSIARILRRAIFTQPDWRALAVARVDYCSTIVPNEYPIAQTLPGFRAKEVRFNYGSLDSIISQMPELSDGGENILVGNSNTMTSNHVDAFHRIAECSLTKQKVIVPLSYGEGDDYKSFVLDRGKYYFGTRFLPILDFIPLKEYSRILSSCGTAVLNHTRQQALGTIMTMTWLGASVYLNPSNPIYMHFKNIGINTFDFSQSFDLHSRIPHGKTYIRECLEKEYSAEVVRKRVFELLALVNS